MKGDSSGYENDHVVGLFAHHVLLTNNKKSEWIVDSGTTCHICHDLKKFVDFRKLNVAEEITVGDGYSVEALEIGTIELNMNVSDRKQQKI